MSYDTSFSVGLTSFSMTVSLAIQVATNGIISFFFMSVYKSIVYMS